MKLQEIPFKSKLEIDLDTKKDCYWLSNIEPYTSPTHKILNNGEWFIVTIIKDRLQQQIQNWDKRAEMPRDKWSTVVNQNGMFTE